MKGEAAPLTDAFVTALEMSAEGHAAMVAAVAPFIDTSISKTVNVPEEYPYADFQGLYLQAWSAGLKEDRIFKRHFSFPMAPRTRQSTALGALQSVFGGGCGLLGVDASAEIVLRGRRLRVIPGLQVTSTDPANPRSQPTPPARGAGSPERSPSGAGPWSGDASGLSAVNHRRFSDLEPGSSGISCV